LYGLREQVIPDKPASICGYRGLITFVEDRPGHDAYYAIDASKIDIALGWRLQEAFQSGIRKSVEWYLHDSSWWCRILDSSYNRECPGARRSRAQ